MDKICVVPMDDSHLTAIALLEQACFSMPWSRSLLEASLQNPSAVMRTALRGDMVAGYIGMYYVLDEGFIYNVAVDPVFRRQGVASALIDSLLACAREKDLTTVTLEVRLSNKAAAALYQKHGFVEVGQRKGYYREPVEDALLMTCTV